MPRQLDCLRARQDDAARKLLGSFPERWGRMDLMSREAIIGVGRVLQEKEMLAGRPPCLNQGWQGGLIVGTRRGSLAVDIEYTRTLLDGPGMASPHLFSYTLPNIPLAEAAIQYGLTGPVFCLISEAPYDDALLEARQWLGDMPGTKTLIVAGALDVIPSGATSEITAQFKVLQT
ncbi:MAG: hypothetical protein M8357_05215 [Desulfobulbaceae bacterium]|nr:hypothetical protein [Desulfobulbaceae bacterium]